jgi:hypothetical protein
MSTTIILTENELRKLLFNNFSKVEQKNIKKNQKFTQINTQKLKSSKLHESPTVPTIKIQSRDSTNTDYYDDPSLTDAERRALIDAYLTKTSNANQEISEQLRKFVGKATQDNTSIQNVVTKSTGQLDPNEITTLRKEIRNVEMMALIDQSYVQSEDGILPTWNPNASVFDFFFKEDTNGAINQGINAKLSKHQLHIAKKYFENQGFDEFKSMQSFLDAYSFFNLSLQLIAKLAGRQVAAVIPGIDDVLTFFSAVNRGNYTWSHLSFIIDQVETNGSYSMQSTIANPKDPGQAGAQQQEFVITKDDLSELNSAWYWNSFFTILEGLSAIPLYGMVFDLFRVTAQMSKSIFRAFSSIDALAKAPFETILYVNKNGDVVQRKVYDIADEHIANNKAALEARAGESSNVNNTADALKSWEDAEKAQVSDYFGDSMRQIERNAADEVLRETAEGSVKVELLAMNNPDEILATINKVNSPDASFDNIIDNLIPDPKAGEDFSKTFPDEAAVDTFVENCKGLGVYIDQSIIINIKSKIKAGNLKYDPPTIQMMIDTKANIKSSLKHRPNSIEFLGLSNKNSKTVDQVKGAKKSTGPRREFYPDGDEGQAKFDIADFFFKNAGDPNIIKEWDTFKNTHSGVEDFLKANKNIENDCNILLKKKAGDIKLHFYKQACAEYVSKIRKIKYVVNPKQENTMEASVKIAGSLTDDAFGIKDLKTATNAISDLADNKIAVKDETEKIDLAKQLLNVYLRHLNKSVADIEFILNPNSITNVDATKMYLQNISSDNNKVNSLLTNNNSKAEIKTVRNMQEYRNSGLINSIFQKDISLVQIPELQIHKMIDASGTNASQIIESFSLTNPQYVPIIKKVENGINSLLEFRNILDKIPVSGTVNVVTQQLINEASGSIKNLVEVINDTIKKVSVSNAGDRNLAMIKPELTIKAWGVKASTTPLNIAGRKNLFTQNKLKAAESISFYHRLSNRWADIFHIFNRTKTQVFEAFRNWCYSNVVPSEFQSSKFMREIENKLDLADDAIKNGNVAANAVDNTALSKWEQIKKTLTDLLKSIYKVENISDAAFGTAKAVWKSEIKFFGSSVIKPLLAIATLYIDSFLLPFRFLFNYPELVIAGIFTAKFAFLGPLTLSIGSFAWTATMLSTLIQAFMYGGGLRLLISIASTTAAKDAAYITLINALKGSSDTVNALLKTAGRFRKEQMEYARIAESDINTIQKEYAKSKSEGSETFGQKATNFLINLSPDYAYNSYHDMLKDKILSQIQVKKAKKKYRTMNGITSDFKPENLKQMIFDQQDIDHLIEKFTKSSKRLKINFDADTVRSGLNSYLSDSSDTTSLATVTEILNDFRNKIQDDKDKPYKQNMQVLDIDETINGLGDEWQNQYDNFINIFASSSQVRKEGEQVADPALMYNKDNPNMLMNRSKNDTQSIRLFKNHQEQDILRAEIEAGYINKTKLMNYDTQKIKTLVDRYRKYVKDGEKKENDLLTKLNNFASNKSYYPITSDDIKLLNDIRKRISFLSPKDWIEEQFDDRDDKEEVLKNFYSNVLNIENMTSGAYDALDKGFLEFKKLFLGPFGDEKGKSQDQIDAMKRDTIMSQQQLNLSDKTYASLYYFFMKQKYVEWGKGQNSVYQYLISENASKYINSDAIKTFLTGCFVDDANFTDLDKKIIVKFFYHLIKAKNSLLDLKKTTGLQAIPGLLNLDAMLTGGLYNIKISSFKLDNGSAQPNYLFLNSDMKEYDDYKPVEEEVEYKFKDKDGNEKSVKTKVNKPYLKSTSNKLVTELVSAQNYSLNKKGSLTHAIQVLPFIEWDAFDQAKDALSASSAVMRRLAGTLITAKDNEKGQGIIDTNYILSGTSAYNHEKEKDNKNTEFDLVSEGFKKSSKLNSRNIKRKYLFEDKTNPGETVVKEDPYKVKDDFDYTLYSLLNSSDISPEGGLGHTISLELGQDSYKNHMARQDQNIRQQMFKEQTYSILQDYDNTVGTTVNLGDKKDEGAVKETIEKAKSYKANKLDYEFERTVNQNPNLLALKESLDKYKNVKVEDFINNPSILIDMFNKAKQDGKLLSTRVAEMDSRAKELPTFKQLTETAKKYAEYSEKLSTAISEDKIKDMAKVLSLLKNCKSKNADKQTAAKDILSGGIYNKKYPKNSPETISAIKKILPGQPLSKQLNLTLEDKYTLLQYNSSKLIYKLMQDPQNVDQDEDDKEVRDNLLKNYNDALIDYLVLIIYSTIQKINKDADISLTELTEERLLKFVLEKEKLTDADKTDSYTVDIKSKMEDGTEVVGKGIQKLPKVFINKGNLKQYYQFTYDNLLRQSSKTQFAKDSQELTDFYKKFHKIIINLFGQNEDFISKTILNDNDKIIGFCRNESTWTSALNEFNTNNTVEGTQIFNKKTGVDPAFNFQSNITKELNALFESGVIANGLLIATSHNIEIVANKLENPKILKLKYIYELDISAEYFEAYNMIQTNSQSAYAGNREKIVGYPVLNNKCFLEKKLNETIDVISPVTQEMDTFDISYDYYKLNKNYLFPYFFKKLGKNKQLFKLSDMFEKGFEK